MVIPEGEEKQRLWKVLEKEVEDIYITSSVPQLLEIAYKEAGKAPAVQFLLERLGISRCELAAFGDGGQRLRASGICRTWDCSRKCLQKLPCGSRQGDGIQ